MSNLSRGMFDILAVIRRRAEQSRAVRLLVIAEPEEWPKYRHRRGTYA
jgi:hypothetical protein